MRKLNIIGLLLFIVCYVSGQSSFYNGTTQILGERKIYSTVAIAVDDINGDQKDDIILFDEGKFLKTFTQTPLGMPSVYKNHTQTSAFGEWAVITGDLDNNGTPEIVASGNENGSEILFVNNGNYSTAQATPSVYSQNTNLVDLNKDGYLDLFVCNDVGENQTYLNNGEGKMIKETIIDFKTSPEDDMSGNYSSIFTDIDSDGDLDLYIGKCRGGVMDPTDRRRINTLYINNGDGTYTEMAQDFGLANGSQTWSVDAGDVDNDGDIDILIANHDREHDLMLNDGEGHFTSFNGLPPESKSFAYQSFFADFDNNGWLDIFITEPSNSYILYNNQMEFSLYDMKQNGKRAFSGATGDFNSDGYIDLYLGFASSFQVPGNQSDIVLLNEGRENNHININLVGSESNRDAVGARVTLFANGGQQIREVIAGRSYGVMNSTVSHFGVGLAEVVDSIIVDWPSGNQTSINEPIPVNNNITINEDGCINLNLQLPNLLLCDGNDVVLHLDETYDSYLWSDGSIADSLIVSEAGSYSVVLYINECAIRSNTFYVTEEDIYPSDEILQPETYIGCIGEYVKLGCISGSEYSWSNGESSRYIYVNEPDIYQVTVSTNCGTHISELVPIGFYELDEPLITEDTVLIGESATLTLEGDDIRWYRNFYDEAIVGLGNSFTTEPLISDTIIYGGRTIEDSGLSINLLNPVPLNSTFDDQFIGNDTLGFKVLSSFRLTSVSVRTQMAGMRSVEIWKDGIQIKSVSKLFETGKSEVVFDLILGIGDYYMTTNELTNIDQLGSSNPKFSYSEQFAGNDKVLDGYLKIDESVKYEDVIPYFFDWKINIGAISCEDRYPVKATVKLDVSLIENEFYFDVYPNPSKGQINIDLDVPAVAELWNIGGKKVIQTTKLNVGKNTIITDLKNGAYVLKLISNNQIVSRVLIIDK